MDSVSKFLHEPAGETDNCMWCETCGMSTVGGCFIHGCVIPISDSKLPSRARLTLPSILHLKQISDDGKYHGKEGVFSTTVIRSRTQFGPLEAPPLLSTLPLPSDVFDVRVITNDEEERLDLCQEAACNWMMFVKPAMSLNDANLAAYQKQDHIYYISTKTIVRGTELRVWYTQSYGRQLGKRALLLATTNGSNERCLESRADLGQLSCECSTKELLPTIKYSDNEHSTHNTLTRLARRKFQTQKKSMPNPKILWPVTRAAIAAKMMKSKKGEMKADASFPSPCVPIVKPSGQLFPARKRGRPKGSRNKLSLDKDGALMVRLNEKSKRLHFQCQHCCRSFHSKEQHRIHEAEHSGQMPYTCGYCKKGFGTKFKVWRHSMIHEQPQDRKCPYCDRAFNRIDHLKNHILTHDSNRRQWSCDRCGKQYLCHSTFTFHMANHDAREGTELRCSLCMEIFTARDELIRHLQCHNRYKPDAARVKKHQCSVCQKMFSTKKDVRRHMVTHTKDRSFLCEFCPQTFTRNDHLSRHYKSNHRHEVLKQVSHDRVSMACQVCLQTFKSSQHLSYHMSTIHKSKDVTYTEENNFDNHDKQSGEFNPLMLEEAMNMPNSQQMVDSVQHHPISVPQQSQPLVYNFQNVELPDIVDLLPMSMSTQHQPISTSNQSVCLSVSACQHSPVKSNPFHALNRVLPMQIPTAIHQLAISAVSHPLITPISSNPVQMTFTGSCVTLPTIADQVTVTATHLPMPIRANISGVTVANLYSPAQVATNSFSGPLLNISSPVTVAGHSFCEQFLSFSSPVAVTSHSFCEQFLSFSSPVAVTNHSFCEQFLSFSSPVAVTSHSTSTQLSAFPSPLLVTGNSLCTLFEKWMSSKSTVSHPLPNAGLAHLLRMPVLVNRSSYPLTTDDQQRDGSITAIDTNNYILSSSAHPIHTNAMPLGFMLNKPTASVDHSAMSSSAGFCARVNMKPYSSVVPSTVSSQERFSFGTVSCSSLGQFNCMTSSTKTDMCHSMIQTQTGVPASELVRRVSDKAGRCIVSGLDANLTMGRETFSVSLAPSSNVGQPTINFLELDDLSLLQS